MPTGLELMQVRPFRTGVVLHSYRSTGGLDYGSFALEQPTEAEIVRRKRIEQGER